MGGCKTRSKLLLGLVILLIVSFTVSATFYEYDEQITIKDSQGSSLGWVKPYYISNLFGDFAHLKYQREGYLVGDTFLTGALIEGTTITLPFGFDEEAVLQTLKIKVNSISSSGVNLDIDTSDLIKDIEDIGETLPSNIEAIMEEAEEQIEDPDSNLYKTINEIDRRVNKWLNRGYYSSLHIINQNQYITKKVSDKVMSAELGFARSVSEKVISIVLDIAAQGAGTGYSVFIKAVPVSIRNDINQFFYNIGDKYDTYVSNSGLVNDGTFTLYFGNPSQNKVSKEFNSELRSMGLPYFSGNKIIGKREYSEDDIGIVAAIPEETVWTENTLTNRFNNDKVRLYKTLIAGIGDNGFEAAADWYNDQLNQAKRLINAISAEGADALEEIGKIAIEDPETALSSATLVQGWILTAMSSAQEYEFDRIDSLGYVVIDKRRGNSYDVLEIHTLNGYQKNYFLNPYEAFQEVQEVIEEVQEVKKIVEQVQREVPAPVFEEPTEEEPEEVPEKITGEVVKEEPKQEPPKKENFFVKIFNTILGWFR